MKKGVANRLSWTVEGLMEGFKIFSESHPTPTLEFVQINFFSNA